MKPIVIAVILFSASAALAQRTKDPGLNSRHASVGHKSASLGTPVITRNTSATAAELAKIEQQGAHASYSTTSHISPSSTAAAPKTPPAAQNKNRPIKFSRGQMQSNIKAPH